MQTIDIIDFQKVDIRIGTIIEAKEFSRAIKPSYQLFIDLGPLGIKKSSAQITDLYSCESLIGKQVVCICNLKPRQIANFISEVLVTGFSNENGEIVLAAVDQPVENGTKLH
ncbi:tRNA-binding protein [Anditalea andensis]|nr:tRNA-binding protein [Anditalea andensis]